LELLHHGATPAGWRVGAMAGAPGLDGFFDAAQSVSSAARAGTLNAGPRRYNGRRRHLLPPIRPRRSSVMNYFITGATGFIGRRLVRKILERRGSIVYFLVRDASEEKLAPLYEAWGVDASRAIPVVGDIAKPNLGLRA